MKVQRLMRRSGLNVVEHELINTFRIGVSLSFLYNLYVLIAYITTSKSKSHGLTL